MLEFAARERKASLLYPMGFAEILDTTFSLYRKHFRLFLRIIALYFGLSLLQECAFTFLFDNSFDFLNAVTDCVIIALAGGGLVAASSTLYLNGWTTMRKTWQQLRNRFFAYFIGFLPWGFVVFVLLVCISALFATPYRIGKVIFLVSVFPVALYFTTAWSFWGFAILIEGKSARAALKRSRQLVKNTWWRVCGITLAIYFLGLAMFVVILFSWDTLMWFTDPAETEHPLEAIWQWPLDEPREEIDFFTDPWGILLWFVIRTSISLVLPIPVIGSMLLYFDLRIRKEAFDLEMMIIHYGGEHVD